MTAKNTASLTEQQAQRLIDACTVLMRRFADCCLDYSEQIPTKTQMMILTCLAGMDDCKMTDLSKATGISLSALTGLVDRLKEKGFVERDRDPDDRRVVKISATAGGRKISREYREKYINNAVQALSRLEPRDRESLVHLFEKMAKTFGTEKG